MAASQKVDSAVSKQKLKLKAFEVKATELTKKLRQEKNRVAIATSLANSAIIRKQEAEHGVGRAVKRRLNDNYRNEIEELKDKLKRLTASYEHAMTEQQKKIKN